MFCAFIIYFLSLNHGSAAIRLLFLGLLLSMLSLMTLLLSLAGNAYLYSTSLRKAWEQNLVANYTNLSKLQFDEYQRLLVTLRPMMVVMGGCYHLDERAVIPFLETVLDKAFLLCQVFPHINSLVLKTAITSHPV